MNNKERKVTVEFVKVEHPINYNLIAFVIAQKIIERGFSDVKEEVQRASESD